MIRRFAFAGVLAMFAIVAWLLGGPDSEAAASEAAVVVRHGDGGMTYALVSFPEEEISSIELLDRSALSLTTVAFGGLGEAVCTLDGEGCPLSDCRQRLCQTGDPESPFWQLFRQDDAGGWVTHPLGASTARVSDGDIDVWSWTGGEANVPPLDLPAIAQILGVTLDDETEGVYVASFDAAGKRINRSESDDSSSVELVIGVAALVLLTAVAVFLAMRRRAGAGLRGGAT